MASESALGSSSGNRLHISKLTHLPATTVPAQQVPHSVLQTVLEPVHRLEESLLLGEPLLLDAQIGDPDGVAVLDAAE